LTTLGLATVFIALIGVTLGSIAGYVGGWTDDAIMRVVEGVDLAGTMNHQANALDDHPLYAILVHRFKIQSQRIN
jgi:hypothetical protein